VSSGNNNLLLKMLTDFCLNPIIIIIIIIYVVPSFNTDYSARMCEWLMGTRVLVVPGTCGSHISHNIFSVPSSELFGYLRARDRLVCVCMCMCSACVCARAARICACVCVCVSDCKWLCVCICVSDDLPTAVRVSR